jgi:hypothetical protein
MRHLLTDPAFPDIVGVWAADEARRKANTSTRANYDGLVEYPSERSLLALIARVEIEATRLW